MLSALLVSSALSSWVWLRYGSHNLHWKTISLRSGSGVVCIFVAEEKHNWPQFYFEWSSVWNSLGSSTVAPAIWHLVVPVRPLHLGYNSEQLYVSRMGFFCTQCVRTCLPPATFHLSLTSVVCRQPHAAPYVWSTGVEVQILQLFRGSMEYFSSPVSETPTSFQLTEKSSLLLRGTIHQA